MTISDSAKITILSIRPSIKIQRVISELAAKAGVVLSQSEASMRIDNDPYERLCIETIGKNQISLAHYFEQNGDLVPDPDIVFLMLGDFWYPISFQNQLRYEESVEQDNDGQIVAILDNMRSMVSFTNLWAGNIVAQGYLEAVKPVGKDDTE